MSDTSAEFFDHLANGGRQPLLGKVRGTAQFDLVDRDGTDHWLVTVDNGDISVSPVEGDAECRIGAKKEFFERVVRGEENTVAAVLRGEIVCSGDVELLLAIQRVFPGPPGQKGPAKVSR